MAIFVLLPVIFYLDLLSVPKVPVLLLVAAGAGIHLWRDNKYSFVDDWRGETEADDWKRLIIRTCGVAVALLLLVWLLNPDIFLGFPRSSPNTWVLVMLLYPFLSALPQELLYRSFFFRRYRMIFGPGAGLAAASALSFSFLHVIYDNPWALALSLVGGILFARTYRRNGSLLLVAAEHALYGCLVFTIGMGTYFYEPF